MKKKIVKYCIFFLLLATFSIFSFKFSSDKIHSENNNSFPKQSGSWYISGRVIIDNNWTDVELMYDWCSGNGSEVSPYVIENLTINAQYKGSCIEIRNSRDNFIIQNSSFSYAGDIEKVDGAIKLYNATNGKIVSNNCSNNKMHGILLTNNCAKNNISNNHLFNNTRGISLYSNSSKNIFFNNTVRNCTFAGLNIAGPSERNQILNNSISDCTYDGITISNENHTLLTNNDISECNAAMVLSSVSYLNVFNNRINSCASVGIIAYDINSSIISYNNISSMIPRGTAISFVDSYDSIISNNFLFDNRGRQITITRGNNVSIIENLILNEIEFDYGDTMISLIYSRFCDISRNQIIKNTTQGTQRMHGLGMWHCSQNNVTENIIYGLILEGLYLEKSNKTHVIGNVIIASNYGIGLKDSCNYNKIIYNEISVTQTVGGEKGISLENYCQHNSLLNNIVNGSKFTTENYGIYLLQSNNNSIIQNIIIDNDFGIYLIRSNLSTISENIIQNFDECITEIDCIGNTIEDNICMTETTPPIPGFDLFIIMGIFFVIFMILIKSVSKFQIRRLEVSSRETCF